jgi:spore germination protein GerM
VTKKESETESRMNIKRMSIIFLFVLLFSGGVVGGYFYFSKIFSKNKPVGEEKLEAQTKTEDLFSLRIYYPVGNRLQFEDRRLPRKDAQIAIAQTTVEEFLKGPAGGMTSNIPKGVKLLGLYKDVERILYVDLSDDFRRNFQGDALSEFYLLKGLYESLISNIQDVENVKILIEGREVETLGGHLYLIYPLKGMVSNEYE